MCPAFLFYIAILINNDLPAWVLGFRICSALLRANNGNEMIGGRRKNVIVSPHVYCPSVTFAKFSISGKSMYARLNRSFGFYNRIVRCFSSPYSLMSVPAQATSAVWYGSNCIHP